MFTSDVKQQLSPCVLVGYSGRMGRWFWELLEGAGLTVIGIDESTSVIQRTEALSNAAFVVFSVPIHATVRVISEYRLMVPVNCLLTDVTSIKGPVVAEMKHHPGEVVGLHPMCAPTTSGLQGQTVVWSGARCGVKAYALRTLLGSLGAKLVEMEPDRHDRVMSLVQAGNHLQSIILAYIADELGIHPEEALSVASPIYRIRTQLIGRILAQAPELYIDMFRENPASREVLELLAKRTNEFVEILGKGDKSNALAFFARASTGFGAYAQQALEESDRLLQYVVKDFPTLKDEV